MFAEFIQGRAQILQRLFPAHRTLEPALHGANDRGRAELRAGIDDGSDEILGVVARGGVRLAKMPFVNLISGLSSNWPALVYWVVVSFSFFYHSLNGLRHLAWDFGKGFETHQVNYSGFIVVVLTLALTLCFWFFLLTKYSF